MDELIERMARQLAVVLNIHYEDDRMFLNREEGETLRQAKGYLESQGIAVPAVVKHVLQLIPEKPLQ